ncbi:HlyD family type I secretion periplasmic adaptor subunit [Duganella aceris]|uniref:Membrane fusion protein (MFP) family protein n=1 Tax=Duganella aceris TaxID=2703883 RepID=A0ABX0FPX2_9BURK|nr:HlyD family type I secretion periplasmic adaptor subunit [Duganella aceris]NGZ86528.1 HlyD family type I secretion periplasmic adaptor subunit [Duganella aceris]
MANMLSKNTTATEVIAHDVTPLEVKTDSSGYARFGWLLILVGVGGFGLWASFAPLDKGVPMQATVTKESNRQSIQHLSGGTIKEILARDGDVVKKGQVLVRMNNVAVTSQAETTRAQYITSRLAEARLLAERDGKKELTFPPTLNEFKTDPRVIDGFSLQKQLFTSRHSSLESELGAIEENIAGLKLQIKGLQESRDSKKVQLDILKEQLVNMRELSKEGYVARARLLDLERTYAQINGQISEDLGTIGRSQRQVTELTLRRMQRTQDFQKEVRSLLADTQREAEALSSRITGQDYDMANADVKAPVDGTVVGLAVFTPGGVVGPGAKMMDLVPTDDPLVVEGQLPVNLIDRVHTGMPVELMFSAFNSNRTPHIPGVVTQVSADRTVEERTGAAFYKVRARVTPEGLKIIEAKKLGIQSGMPVEMFVKTGERTLMSYLLKPIYDRAKTSLSED